MLGGITSLLMARVLAVVCGLLLLAVGVQTWRMHSGQAEHAKLVADYERRLGLVEKAAREESEKNRVLEGKLAAKAVENAHELDAAKKEVNRLESAARAADADNGRLRNVIAGFAAGRGRTAPDTTDACRARAEALGVLLEESMRLQIESAADAERDAADYRALFQHGRAIGEALPSK